MFEKTEMTVVTPDQISPLELPSVPLEQRSELPETPAVYFVISEKSEILYIGQAINLRNRWIRHHRLQELTAYPCLVNLAWLEIQETSILNALEESMINYFRPSLNGKKRVYLSRSNSETANNKVKSAEMEARVTALEREVFLLQQLQAFALENEQLRHENKQLKAWRDSVVALTKIAPTF